MRKLVVIILVLLTSEVFAIGTGGGAVPLLRSGAGARAVSLGGAFSANYDDASVMYWNPAATARLGKTAIATMYSWLSEDRTLNYLNISSPLDFGTIGGAILNYSISGIEGRGEEDTAEYYEFSDMENAYYIMYAKEVIKSFSIGINIKAVQIIIGESNAFGLSGDIGLHMTPAREIAVGVVFQDLFGRVTWSTGRTEKIPFVMKVGALIDPADGLFKIALEGEQNEFEGMLLKSGLEFGFFKMIFIRGGIIYGLKSHEFDYALGVGARYKLGNVLLSLDYAFQAEEFDISFEAHHKLSINVYF